MKKKELKLWRMLSLVVWISAVSFSLLSCTQEKVDDESESSEDSELLDTTSAIAVTGFVGEYGCTYAHISSYANLNLLPMTNGELVIGVELVEADAENNIAARKSITSSLDGNKFIVMFSTLSPETEYKYRSFVTHGGLTHYGEYRMFLTKEFKYEAVDLGLSVKWATCNVDASSPVEYGGYYTWGGIEAENKDTRGYSDFSGTESDVAHVRWGDGWRMPTLDDINELCNKCTYEWIFVNGVAGQLVTGPNGNSIFLPAAGCYNGKEITNGNNFGYYWSSTDYTGSGYCVFSLLVGHNMKSYALEGYNVRENAFTIRPVKK